MRLQSKEEEQQQQQQSHMLPDELWEKILEEVDDNSVMAFATVCKQLRCVQQRLGRRLKTNLKGYFYNLTDSKKLYHHLGFLSIDKELTALSEDWCLWSMSSLTLKKEKGKRRRIMHAAAFWGHLNALKQCRATTLFDEQTCIFAALGGQLEVLKYLHHEKGCHWDIWTSVAAAREGHLDVLKYAHEKGCPCNEMTCEVAAFGGHLEVLKYAHEKLKPWDEKTCAGVARGGHLEVLKYLHEQGCPWNEETCRCAASGGHLEVLKYLHENGCPWNEMTCMAAAERGHLEMLKYAHENGCPWDEETCYWAAGEGHLDVLKYAIDNGCDWDEEELVNISASFHDLELLEFLRANIF